MPPKRKAADGDESLSSGKKAKPTKSTTTTKRGRGKKNAEVEIEEESKPRVKRINKHLKAKVQQIADLIDTTERYQSRLKWSDSHENCVVVSEACLLGSLMAMHADWGLTDPRMASLIEVGEAIVEQYEKKRAMNEEMVKMVVLDVSKETAFVEGIQQKIEGWGLEGINLLEIELELCQRNAQNEATFRLFSAFESSDRGDDGAAEIVDEPDTSEKDVETSSSSHENTQHRDTDTPAITTNLTLTRKGVCPAPLIAIP